MNGKILGWEIAGAVFIMVVGSMLHFVFELSGFWRPIALFAAVNESTWEHLKMVFWPAFLFFLVEYQFLKNCTRQFWAAKALCLFIMPFIITAGWYLSVALIGDNLFIVNMILFIGAIIAGQLIGLSILAGRFSPGFSRQHAALLIVLLTLAFAVFTYFPPRIFLFEHIDLANTGEYGILDSYEDLLIFK